MTKNIGFWIILVLIVGGFAWLIFGNKPKVDQTRNESSTPSESAPIGKPAAIVNQVRKNSKGTLSLVSVNSTGVVVASRELSFDEAVKLVGNVNDVCVGRYNVGSAYVQCTKVRTA